MIESSMLLQGNISEILFLVQQQRNNNVIIMVVIMMMYFIIERALVQIPPPTVKETPKDPKVGCQFFAWLKLPGSAVSIHKHKPSYPLGKALDDPKSKQIHGWGKRQNKGMVAGSRLGSAVLTGRGMCGGHWAWHMLRGTHTCVKGMGFYCSEMLFHTPRFCRLRGSPEGSLWKKRSLWILCGRKS